MNLALFRWIVWNIEIIYGRLAIDCINHREENPMKKSLPTLKLDQKKMLGFKIQPMKQSAGSKVGGKAGSKIGAKPGIKNRLS